MARMLINTNKYRQLLNPYYGLNNTNTCMVGIKRVYIGRYKNILTYEYTTLDSVITIQGSKKQKVKQVKFTPKNKKTVYQNTKTKSKTIVM